MSPELIMFFFWGLFFLSLGWLYRRARSTKEWDECFCGLMLVQKDERYWTGASMHSREGCAPEYLSRMKIVGDETTGYSTEGVKDEYK